MSTHERTKGEIQRYTEISLGRIAGRAEQLINDLARSTQVPEEVLAEAVARILCPGEGWERLRGGENLPKMRNNPATGRTAVESMEMDDIPRHLLPETTAPNRRVVKNHSGRPGKFRCNICDSRDPNAKGFRSSRALRRHKELKHWLDPQESQQPKLPFVKKKTRKGAGFPRLCRICKKPCNSPHDMGEHYRKFHPEVAKRKI